MWWNMGGGVCQGGGADRKNVPEGADEQSFSVDRHDHRAGALKKMSKKAAVGSHGAADWRGRVMNMLSRGAALEYYALMQGRTEIMRGLQHLVVSERDGERLKARSTEAAAGKWELECYIDD
jgi:hypothetical protein